MTLQKILVFLALVFLLPGLACSIPGQAMQTVQQATLHTMAVETTAQVIEQSRTQAKAGLPPLDPEDDYFATFNMRFEGASSWVYQQITRQLNGLREVSLHIDGVPPANNPGDVRVVTDGSTTWMIGPGTDHECVQFPNNQGMDPAFLYPQSLAPVDDLPGKMEVAGEEEIDGRAVIHYQASGLTFGGWRDSQVDLWLAKDNQELLRFSMQAVGADPFFGAGEGQVTANYDVSARDVGAIEPVAGCDIAVPVPASPEKFVRLPGMASFENRASLSEMQQFYQQALAQDGWEENEAPAQQDNVIVLSYIRGAEEVQIQIESLPDGGSKVKLVFLQRQ